MAPRPAARWMPALIFNSLILTTLVTAVAAVLVPGAARADVPPQPVVVKPTVGWAADWHFTDTSSWTYSMTIPGVSVSGTGYDTDDVRYFTGVLTDTSSSSTLCAYLTFAEAGGSQTHVACDGTVTFTQFDPTPTTYTFTLALRNAANTWRATSYLKVPTTTTNPELRAAGNGAQWAYSTSTQVNYSIVRPGSTVVGVANAAGSTFRSTSATTAPSECTVTVIIDENEEQAAGESGCGARGGNTITASGLYEEFEVRNCVPTTMPTRPPAPPLRLKCVPVIVM